MESDYEIGAETQISVPRLRDVLRGSYFYKRANSVLLGFLGAVAMVLLFVMCAFWIGHRTW
jgi:hypothetical protein